MDRYIKELKKMLSINVLECNLVGSNSSESYITNSLNDITEYLLSLRTLSAQKLLHHRRKNFVFGLIVASDGVMDFSKKLLRRKENPFNYILTYKHSQDHIIIIFHC